MFIIALLASALAFLVAIVGLGIIQGLTVSMIGQAGLVLQYTQPYRTILNVARLVLSLLAAWAAFAWASG